MSFQSEKSIIITDNDLFDLIFGTINVDADAEPIELAPANTDELAPLKHELTFEHLEPVLPLSKRISFTNKELNTILTNQRMKFNDTSSKDLINFVFIIPAYNSAKWVHKIFDSIRNQFYSKKNYRIIYVNDKSDDNTLIEIDFYQKNNPGLQITTITNEERQWPAYSRYIACQKCKDSEICIFLDGDDWLVNNSTLNILNKVYQNPDIQCTFGSMKNAPWQFKKWKHYHRTDINPDSSVYFPHLRTTRAKVAKAVPSYYLQDKNYTWFKVCTDIALFMAIVEAVGEKRYIFIKEELVYYNTYNAAYNTKEGFNQSKNSEMRIMYKNAIREKVPMKELDFSYLKEELSNIQNKNLLPIIGFVNSS